MRFAAPLIALSLLSTPALADDMKSAGAASVTAPQIQAFDQAAFDAAQRAGRPVLVWVHAPWCPVCLKQEKVIQQVTRDPAYRDLAIFRIDFDTQKPLWQKFGATSQSTLIGFHGKRETARLTHETADDRITGVIESTLR